MKPSTMLMPTAVQVACVPFSTSTELAEITDEIKGLIHLIRRQVSKTAWMCHSLEALILCNGSERSLCRHLKLDKTVLTQDD